MPKIDVPSAWALVSYVLIGGLVGVIATFVTRGAYWIEDLFGKLPIHWMWWPAVGGVAVGLIGLAVPLTLGVGYPNIVGILGGGEKPAGVTLTIGFVGILVVAKFLSWAIALGSGTSGGTLAPLFTMGGGAGLLMGAVGNWLFPGAHIDIHVAALVGMAAMFAGAARAMLTSVVFAFETTLQPMGLLPLLGGCAMSYLVSSLLMRNTIMTEKIVRRGIRVPAEYISDYLDQVLVKQVASKDVVALPANQPVGEVRAWLFSEAADSHHQGFPVVDAQGNLVGMVTRRDIDRGGWGSDAPLSKLITRPPVVVHDDCSLRQAADHMVRHGVGRLPVISRQGGKLVGMITRSDLLGAHGRRLKEMHERAAPTVRVPFLR
jgi:CBS domain-containing protein